MKKIKVLHCYKTYYPATFGGIEQVIFQLSEAVIDDNIDSTVFCVNNDFSEDSKPFYNHHVVKSKKSFELASTPFSFDAFKKFKKLAKSADLIHYHFPYPFMDILHFVTNVKKPTVLSYHSDIIKQKNILAFYRPLMNVFLEKIDKIVCASPNYLKTSDILQKYKNKVEVIPYGIPDISTFNKDEEVSKLIDKDFPNGYLLFVGSFRYYKGLHYLLEAVKGSNIPLVLLGAGDKEVELKKYVIANDMKNVSFVGAERDEIKYSYLSRAKAFVFPSHLRSEAFGISLVEAACFGLPMISCEIGTGTTFININNHTGLVVEGANVAQLKSAIDELWNNEYRSKVLGDNARKRYEELFSAKVMAEKYSQVYREVINKFK